jgi:acylglycerol lipase
MPADSQDVASQTLLRTSDGLDLFLEKKEPAGPRAVVIFHHGWTEHCGLFSHFMEELCKHDYAAWAFDCRGHGRSTGQRGHASSLAPLLDDLTRVIIEARERHPGKPIFLYGDSMGGNIVLNFGLRKSRGWNELSGVIAASPWLRLAFEPPRWKVWLALLLVRVWPSFSLREEPREPDMSRDPVALEEAGHDPLIHRRMSAGLFVAMTGAATYALEHAAEFPLPLLLLHGTADRITRLDGSVEFFKKGPEPKALKEYPGAFHRLHTDLCNQNVIREVIDWLNERTKVRGPSDRD